MDVNLSEYALWSIRSIIFLIRGSDPFITIVGITIVIHKRLEFLVIIAIRTFHCYTGIGAEALNSAKIIVVKTIIIRICKCIVHNSAGAFKLNDTIIQKAYRYVVNKREVWLDIDIKQQKI